MKIWQPGQQIEKLETWGMGLPSHLMKTERNGEDCTLTPLEGDTLYYIWTNTNPNKWEIVYLLRRANGDHKAILRIKESFEQDRLYVLSTDDSNLPQQARATIYGILKQTAERPVGN